MYNTKQILSTDNKVVAASRYSVKCYIIEKIFHTMPAVATVNY